MKMPTWCRWLMTPLDVGWFYGCVFLASVVLLFASHAIPSAWALTQQFVRDLGFAGIISVILIFTVERVTRTQHAEAARALLQKISSDVFQAVYLQHVPPEVFAEVEKSLFRAEVVRSEYEIDYALSNLITPDFPEKDFYFSCNIFSRYRVKNLRKEPITWNMQIFLEAPLDPALLPLTNITGVQIGDRSLSQEEIRERQRTDTNYVSLSYPVKLTAGGSEWIAMNCTTTKRKVDTENWASRIPATGLKLSVTSPDGVDVRAVSNHSENLRAYHGVNRNTRVWELNHGIFPFQSVIFWWNANSGRRS